MKAKSHAAEIRREINMSEMTLDERMEYAAKRKNKKEKGS